MKLRSSIKTGEPLVVGTVHDESSLRTASRAGRDMVDLLELRVDAFADRPERLLRVVPQLQVPVIITVRDASEGGVARLTPRMRAGLFEMFLPHAAMIDVELRSVKKMATTIAQARSRGAKIILSFHDFRATPSGTKLRRLLAEARRAGADVFKVAATTDSLRDVMRLAGLLNGKVSPPCSVMGMGRFGKVSRLLFARAGSVLNYAYLGRAQVSGQWPAGQLRRRLDELA
jgi:3-dehydroquinate dehydratase-1